MLLDRWIFQRSHSALMITRVEHASAVAEERTVAGSSEFNRNRGKFIDCRSAHVVGAHDYVAKQIAIFAASGEIRRRR